MHDTWLSSVLLLLHTALQARGLDGDALAREAGIEPGLLRDPDQRIPDAHVLAFWTGAERATGHDPCLGLDVARLLHPTALHAVGYAWLASSNLMEAGQRLLRYWRVLTSAESAPRVRVQDTPTGRLRWLIFDSLPDAPAPTSFDARLVSVVRLCRSVAGEGFAPAAVRVRHARLPGVAPLEAFYGVLPQYGADEYSLAVHDNDLTRTLSTANAELALMADQTASAYLARHDKHDVLTRVRTLMLELMPLGDFHRESVAKKMNLSTRTLQRRLQDHGHTFASLTEDTRQQLAQEYLRVEHHSVQEVAWRLGYAELASFTKAFKRWTGLTPSAWRALQSTARP